MNTRKMKHTIHNSTYMESIFSHMQECLPRMQRSNAKRMGVNEEHEQLLM